MDGNFGLVRKKTSGISYEGPKHKNLMFCDQDVVDQFVEGYGSQGIDENVCITSI